MAVTDRLAGTTQSLAVKGACTVRSTGALTLSSTQVVDGIAVGSNERVLVADQADASDNGIYISSNSTWIRSKDFDGSRDAIPGTLVYVDRGATHGATLWVVNSSSTATSIVIGSDDVDWSKLL